MEITVGAPSIDEFVLSYIETFDLKQLPQEQILSHLQSELPQALEFFE